MTYSQENSNSYPKTVTGVIDFGKDTFTVFTQAQKKKVYEYILRYEDCSTNAIIDSIIIQNYRIKNTADTLAISLCRKDNAVKDIQINLMSGMLDNRNELIAEKDKEISTYIKQLKKEKRIFHVISYYSINFLKFNSKLIDCFLVEEKKEDIN